MHDQDKPSRVGAIVAMTDARVIGRKGEGMPWHYSEDLRRFARLTTGHTIIMGRYTFESVASKPLPRRRNIVISRESTYENVETFADVDAALADCSGDVWIIGGGMIYSAALHHCEFLDVTYVPDQITGDDLVYFPEIDPEVWEASALTPCSQDERLTRRLFTRR